MVADASNNQDRRTGYVGELGVKMPCRVAALVNIDLEATQTINGVVVEENDYVLATAQTDPTENGVYQVSTGTWNRAVWFNNQLSAVPGTLIFTVEGTLKSNSLWQTVCDDNPIDFGTSEINFNFFATTGSGTFLFAANNLDDVDDVAISRENLGVEIGVDVQAYSNNLQALSALTVGTSSGNIPVVGTTSSTETLAGLAELATQAETIAGAASKIVDPEKLLALFPASTVGTTSLLKMPINIGGSFASIWIQFGVANVSANSTSNISITAFPSACYHVQATYKSNSTGLVDSVAADIVNSSTISITNGSDSGLDIFWMAIGK